MNRLRFDDVHTAPFAGLTLTLDPGCHWIRSSDASAAAHFIDVCCGVVRPKRGQVTLDEERVDALPRTRIGVLPFNPRLPSQRVEHLIRSSLLMKGSNQNPIDLLSHWDLAAWASRASDSLDVTDARKLVLLLALATPAARLLALHDPFSLGLSQEQVGQQLSKAAENGAIVVLSLPSLECHPPQEMNPVSSWVLHQSRLLPGERQPDEPHSATITSLFVNCSDPRALTERLCQDSRVVSLKVDQLVAPGLLEVTGMAMDEVARAVADAALQGSINIRQMGLHRPTGRDAVIAGGSAVVIPPPSQAPPIAPATTGTDGDLA